MPGNAAAAAFSTFYYMFTGGSLCHGDMDDIIYDIEGSCEG